MNDQGDPRRSLVGGVTRSIASGGAATGVAYGLGLSPELSGIVGGAVTVVAATGEGTEAVRRHLRGSPGSKERALRSIISNYLSAMQERLSKSDRDLNGNSVFADRVKEYANEIEPYDKTLAAALLSLNGALVLSSDFQTPSAEKNVRDVLQGALNQSNADIRPRGRLVYEPGFLHHIFFWKKGRPVRGSGEASEG